MRTIRTVSMHAKDGEKHAGRDKSKVAADLLMNKNFDFPGGIPIPLTIAELFD